EGDQFRLVVRRPEPELVDDLAGAELRRVQALEVEQREVRTDPEDAYGDRNLKRYRHRVRIGARARNGLVRRQVLARVLDRGEQPAVRHARGADDEKRRPRLGVRYG